MKFECPECGKELVAADEGSPGLVIKSKLVFLNDAGEVLCKCKKCKTISALPLTFKTENSSISPEPILK